MRMIGIGLFGLLIGSKGEDVRPVDNTPGRDTTVGIRTFQFRPTALVVSVGTRVAWTNGDEIEHTVTAGVPDSASGGFNGIMKVQGAVFTFTFTRTGTFSYYCDRHHFMRGEIRVTSTGEN